MLNNPINHYHIGKQRGKFKMQNINYRIIKTCFIAVVMLMATSSSLITATEPKSSSEEIAYFILQHLHINKDEPLLYYIWGPVNEGEQILTTNECLFDVPCQGSVMYIDLYPMANLFHPVQYVFLADHTKEIIVFDTQSPPLNFQEYEVVDTDFSELFYSLVNRRASIPQKIEPIMQNTGRDSRWAVLMNGGYDQYNNHVRYWNDLSNIYITLVTTYEFADENIIVLCSDGLNPAPDQSNGQNSHPDLDGDGDNDIMYACTLANVNMVFASLAQNFTGNEKLFVFTTDHGSSVGGWNTVQNLWNHETLTDAHFASLLAAIPAFEIICTFEPCFSGGFLDDVVVPPGPIVASSACRHDEYSWAMSGLMYDEYVFHWTAAVKGADAYGNLVDADYNQDGFVTMDEAYIYAEAHDTQSENPQYGEYPQDIGSTISLWITSDPPAKPARPSGPTVGIWFVEYTFSTSTTEPDGENIYYQFDWGDGSTSEWLGPYTSGQTVSGSYSWTTLGVYNVTVKARDIWGATSTRSDPLLVTITDNTPPDKPEITGPTEGKPGKPYLFNTVTSDAQGHEIYYFIDWGDDTSSGWLGPYVSGTMIHITHTWAVKGSYVVKVKAKDSMESESDWSTLSIAMPKDYRLSIQMMLQRIFERFPHLFPLLKTLVGL